jgi:endogenous inhibitor of DNA gyrase (YacG/DUF329 family)
MAGRLTKERCVICNSPVTTAHAPFCSARCRDADLGKWLSGSYAITSDDPLPEDDENDN